MLLRVARVVSSVAMLAALALVLATRWDGGGEDEVRGQLALVSAPALAGAFAYSVLALAAGMLAWRALLADLGSPLPVGAASRALVRRRLARYRPGGRAAAPGLGVPPERAAAAGLALDAVTLGVGLLVALAALPSLVPAGAPGWLRWSPALVPLVVVCLTPRVLSALARLPRRRSADGRLSWTGVGTAVLALLGTWLAYGLHVTLLGWSLGAGPADLLVPATGAFAAAWCAGFLVPRLPAGAGVRDVVLILALADQLPSGAAAAAAVAILSRLLVTVAAAAAALVGTAAGRRPGPKPAAPAALPGPTSGPGAPASLPGPTGGPPPAPPRDPAGGPDAGAALPSAATRHGGRSA